MACVYIDKKERIISNFKSDRNGSEMITKNEIKIKHRHEWEKKGKRSQYGQVPQLIAPPFKEAQLPQQPLFQPLPFQK